MTHLFFFTIRPSFDGNISFNGKKQINIQSIQFFFYFSTHPYIFPFYPFLGANGEGVSPLLPWFTILRAISKAAAILIVFTAPNPFISRNLCRGWFAIPLNEPKLARISSAIFSAGFPLMPEEIRIARSSASVRLSGPSSLSLPPGCRHF